MSQKRAKILENILNERSRQDNLPGTEFDIRNLPNDWIAIIVGCVSEEVRRFNQIREAEDYETSLIQAAAVIVAALEHIDVMKEKGLLK